MMKLFVALLVLAVTAQTSYGALQCSMATPAVPTGWIDLKGDCLSAMRNQIQTEIDASYTYLAMGAYFSRDTVNRPGFADLFFKSAKEERDHGAKLIEYLSMRGKLNDGGSDGVTGLIRVPAAPRHDWTDGATALAEALKLETKVTNSIRKLISTCEKGHNYYHLVDYLTGVYLEEQLHGQRELAGKLVTLEKMKLSNGALGEFLFDKNL